MLSRFGLAALLLVAIHWQHVEVAAAAPSIRGVSLRGLQAGAATKLTIDGDDLQGEPKLLAPFAIAKQEVLAAASNQVQLQITLDASVPPGIYPVRLACEKGISPPIMLGVDRLPQLPMAEKVDSLPVALTGALAGGQILKTVIEGKKDQLLVVDLEVQRLGANFKPVVRLYDSRGKQVAFSPPKHALGGDARIALTLPADDTYTIELHDLLYRASGPGYFRLKIGALQYADFALPLAVAKGMKTPLRFTSSNLPGDLTSEFDATPFAFAARGALSAELTEGFTGAAPNVLITEANEAVETAPPAGEKQMLGAVPCGVSGTIATKNEEDQYLVPVVAGQKLRVQVTARRLGSFLDGVLILRNAQGNELARNDDSPGTPDPTLEYTVPPGMEQLLVCVRDMENRSGADFVYHLSVRDAATPEVVATANTTTINVPAGGTTLVPISITRTHYDGPLRIAVDGLVGDVRIAGEDIPAGVNSALLTLTARGGSPVHGLPKLTIRAADPNVPLARPVLGPEGDGATRYQPWTRQQFGLAVAPSAAASVRWNLAMEREKAFLGGKLPLPLTLQRDAATTGDVRVRVVTTQPQPKKKVKENNQDKEVDDLDRTLRLVEGTPVFKPDQQEVVVNLAIPGDLPARDWQVVVVAEQLAADGKTVTATSYTSATSISPATPFKLELTSPPQAEGRAGAGPAGSYTGKIVREPGFHQPVTLTLTGLPPEVKQVPRITLAPEQADFTLPLTFEFGSKAGEHKNLQLSGYVADAPLPSAGANVELKIVPGEQPPQ